MHYLDSLLRLIASGLLLGVITLLVTRKLYREFPFFFTYAAFSIAAHVFRHIASGHPVGYFIVYWSAEAIYAILALLVIREVFHHVFRVEYQLFRWMRFLLPVTVVVILGFSIYQGMESSAGYNKIRYAKEMIYWFDVGVHAFQVVLLLLLFALRLVFPVGWLRYEFGILAGFGCNAIFTTTADLLWFEHGTRYAAFFQYGPPAGYILATLIWLHAFALPPEKIKPPDYTLKEAVELINQQWGTFDVIRKWLRRNRPFQLSR